MTTTAETVPWSIILAGGEGTRLAPLTRALYGSDLPKQFAVLDGERSLLQRTVERAAAMGALDRIVVVVSEARAALAREQLAGYPGVVLLAQPVSRDTAPGLMFPLAYIRARDPGARVVVLPADHYIPNPRPLWAALARADAHPASRDRVALVGVEAERPETEYGWIVPGRRIAGHAGQAVWTVDRFVEKPAEPIARHLHERGAVWNTFIAAGPAAAFWELACTHLPHHAAAFEGWASGGAPLADLYATMPAASWSHDVIAHTSGGTLALVSMAGSGWSDWGSPNRVFESLAGTAALDRLLARVAA